MLVIMVLNFGYLLIPEDLNSYDAGDQAHSKPLPMLCAHEPNLDGHGICQHNSIWSTPGQ